MKIIPPGMPFPQALRLGYVGEIRMPGYLEWLRTLACHTCHIDPGGTASHPNFYKTQKSKGPDPLAIPECLNCNLSYDRCQPQEPERLQAAALYLLQAIAEGRLVWKSK